MDSNRYEDEEVYYDYDEGENPETWADYDDEEEIPGEVDSNKQQRAPPSKYLTKSTKTQHDAKSPKVVASSTNNNDYESAIDREIRQIREREEELKRDQEKRLLAQQQVSQSQKTSMPIHKVPQPVKVDHGPQISKSATPPLPSSPPPSATMYKELPEVDQDSVFLKQESIIDREIREQQEKESTLRTYLNSTSGPSKEDEQSEFERQEKEHEKVQAHESIVEREIRLQRERELEIKIIHKDITDIRVASPTIPVTPAPPVPQVEPVAMTTTNPESEVFYEDPPTQVMYDEVPYEEPQEPNIAYEDAISTSCHQGESIIARELREQKDRDQELRQRYTDMGLQEMLVRQEPSDTPFNAPEPAQPDIAKLPARAKATIKTIQQRGMKKSVSEPVKISSSTTFTQQKTNNADPMRVTTSVSQHTIGQQGSTAEESHKAEVPKTPKVKPLEEPDGFDVSYRFVPQVETPIEREMRLARGREDELRQSRGFPTPIKEAESEVEIKEVTPISKPQVVLRRGDEGDGKVMKKFASSRLQHEIEKEKLRELDLRSQGAISTLSEERIGGQTKYVDVIPKEQLDKKKAPNWKTTQGSPAARTSSPAPAPVVASHDVVDTSVQPKAAQKSNSIENGASAAQQTEVVVTSTNVKQPVVTRKYSTHTQQLIQLQDERYRGTRATPNMAESRIEREMREMKAREEELRNLRLSFEEVNSQLPSNGSEAMEASSRPANGHESHHVPLDAVELQHMHQSSSTSNQNVKVGRRKSALAEEWEKKFGANN